MLLVQGQGGEDAAHPRVVAINASCLLASDDADAILIPRTSIAAFVHASGWVGVQSSRILINSFHKNAKANPRSLEYGNAFIVSSTGVQLYTLHAKKLKRLVRATLCYTGFSYLQDVVAFELCDRVIG